MLVVDSISNNLDGRTVRVNISGTPSGSLYFYASRTPDSSKSLIVPYVGSSGAYDVQLNHGGIWYIWAYDNNGFSSTFEACWMGTSNAVDLDECGQKLRDVLWDNRKALNIFLKQWYQDADLKSVIYGWEGEVIEFPCIVINNPKIEERYIGTNWLKEIQFRFNINFIITKSDENTELSLAVRFARAGQMILNQPAYETLNLPGGVSLNFCQAIEGEDGEMQLADVGFCAVGSLIWTGNYVTCDNGS